MVPAQGRRSSWLCVVALVASASHGGQAATSSPCEVDCNHEALNSQAKKCFDKCVAAELRSMAEDGDVFARDVLDSSFWAQPSKQIWTPEWVDKVLANRPVSQFGERPSSVTPKVFGLGLGKTGTISLAVALSKLGLTVHHGSAGFFPEAWFPGRSSENVSSLMRLVDANVDTAMRNAPEKLLDALPEAKFILTVRDPEAWWRSAESFDAWQMSKQNGVRTIVTQIHHKEQYGSFVPNKTLWQSRFLSHIEKVRSAIPEKQLLVIDVTAGNMMDNMERLCGFLEVPCIQQGFPHEHATKDLVARETHLLQDEAPNWDARVTAARSRRAYVTLLGHVNHSPYKQQFVEGAKVLAQSLRDTGTKHDIICLVVGELTEAQEEELGRVAQVIFVDRVPPAPRGLLDNDYHAIQRAKAALWSLVEYEKIMYIDADSIVSENVDKLFDEMDADFVAAAGYYAPVNGAWFMLRPSYQALHDMYRIFDHRRWTPANGWLGYGPFSLGAAWQNSTWDFWGSYGDQGMLLYYFFLLRKTGALRAAHPQAVVHFGGARKPWQRPAHSKLFGEGAGDHEFWFSPGMRLWHNTFERLQNSSHSSRRLTEAELPREPLVSLRTLSRRLQQAYNTPAPTVTPVPPTTTTMPPPPTTTTEGRGSVITFPPSESMPDSVEAAIRLGRVQAAAFAGLPAGTRRLTEDSDVDGLAAADGSPADPAHLGGQASLVVLPAAFAAVSVAAALVLVAGRRGRRGAERQTLADELEGAETSFCDVPTAATASLGQPMGSPQAAGLGVAGI